MTARRRNLVIVRAGNASLHPAWVASADRSFDLYISYYGTEPDRYRQDADRYEMRRGPKWSCLADLLAAEPALVDAYDAFWFPDDDLATDTATIDRMFALFHVFGLALAQPALTRDSYYSYRQLLHRSEYLLRYVGFVEVMAPLFTRAALRTCLPTWRDSRSGWGLDWVWAHLLAAQGPRAIGILDATPVKHTRPLGGELYKQNPELDPRKDLDAVVAKYGAQIQRYRAKYVLTGVVRETPAPLTDRLALVWRRVGGEFRRVRDGVSGRSAGRG
jgi:hypothetical protein